ncbi:MAG: hypothetical protein AAFO75_00785 [Pseudomonadota bacterium]
MPEITRRSSTRRAPGWFFGMKGSIAAHCSSFSQNSLIITRSAATSTLQITICHQ